MSWRKRSASRFVVAISLWGPRIHNAFADMGVMGYESIDLDKVMADDEQEAVRIDEARVRQVDETIAVGAAVA